MATRRLKLILAGALAAGGLSCLTVSGTYALLTAETSNRGSTIQSGTLTLGNTVESGTTCYSYTGAATGNGNQACQPLLTASSDPASWRYPGATASARVQIRDDGSIDGRTLRLYMPSCASSTTPGAEGHAGGGNPCASQFAGATPAGLQLSVQETDAAWSATRCWYPVQVAGTCSDVGNSLAALAQNAFSAGTSIAIGSGPARGQTRYFVVAVKLPSNAPNTLQGQQAVFALTWQLTT